MKPISTFAHGVLDYATGATLLALPRLMYCSPALRQMMTGMAAVTFAYSFFTRYELGVVKVLSMPAHLAIDAANGVIFLMAPFVFLREEPVVKNILFGLGLYSIAASLLTQTERLRPSLVDNVKRAIGVRA